MQLQAFIDEGEGGEEGNTSWLHNQPQLSLRRAVKMINRQLDISPGFPYEKHQNKSYSCWVIFSIPAN